MVVVTKKCNKCSKEKPLGAFSKDSQLRDGFRNDCKECQREYDKNWRKNNSERCRTNGLKWVADNREKSNGYKAKWRLNNSDKDKTCKLEWAIKNKQKINEYAKQRARRIKQATPFWLTQEEKADIVDMWLSRPDGFQVDHIVPIQGKDFSGLNVPWNLRYLDRIENIRKKNKLPEKELQIGSRY